MRTFTKETPVEDLIKLANWELDRIEAYDALSTDCVDPNLGSFDQVIIGIYTKYKDKIKESLPSLESSNNLSRTKLRNAQMVTDLFIILPWAPLALGFSTCIKNYCALRRIFQPYYDSPYFLSPNSPLSEVDKNKYPHIEELMRLNNRFYNLDLVKHTEEDVVKWKNLTKIHKMLYVEAAHSSLVRRSILQKWTHDNQMQTIGEKRKLT